MDTFYALVFQVGQQRLLLYYEMKSYVDSSILCPCHLHLLYPDNIRSVSLNALFLHFAINILCMAGGICLNCVLCTMLDRHVKTET